jgi:hypothetical protein
MPSLPMTSLLTLLNSTKLAKSASNCTAIQGIPLNSLEFLPLPMKNQIPASVKKDV